MRYTSKLLAAVFLMLSLSGCMRYHVNAGPSLAVPGALLTQFDHVPSHVNTKKEMQDYLIDSVKLCRKRAEQLGGYQQKYNQVRLAK